ncbi:MAG: hypothetical protein ABJH72_18195 [Reichenbachiella sp.]|uniref:hypothetical protein n=1 Tax=Reichenbachiella sp. TaxID=2184521 RepID=UPI003298915B
MIAIFRGGLLLLLVINTLPLLIAQEASQMQQFFAMNPMIERDPLFQSVQNSIQNRISRTGPGLNEEASIRLLNKLRKSIKSIRAIVSHKPGQASGKNKFEFRAYFGEDTIPVLSRDFPLDASIDAQGLVDSIADYNEVLIRDFLSKNLKRPTNTSSPEEQLIFLALGRMVEGFTEEPYEPNMSYHALISKLIQAYKNELEKYIEIVKRESQFIGNLSADLQKVLIDRLNSELQVFLSSKRDQLTQYLNIVEGELEGFKEKVNNKLIAANTGISVSGAEGNLGGGLYASLKTNRSSKGRQLEIGVYINGAGEMFKSNPDSVKVSKDMSNPALGDTTVVQDENVEQPFLLGVAFKYQINPRFQTNFLFTHHVLRGDNIDTRSSYEIGGGVLYNTQGNLILGLAGFYQFLDKSIMAGEVDTGTEARSMWSVGVSFQNSVPGSPMIIIGIAKKDSEGDPSPTIQVSYPLKFN